jgi:hypothetical protein
MSGNPAALLYAFKKTHMIPFVTQVYQNEHAHDTERSHAPLMKAADEIFMPTAYDRPAVVHKI